MASDIDIKILAKDLASQVIAGLSGNIKELSQSVAGGGSQSMTGSFLKANVIWDLAKSALGGVTSVISGVIGSIKNLAKSVSSTIGTFIGVAGDIESVTLGFRGILGSTEKATKAVANLQAFAKNTPFEFQGLAEASFALTTVTKNADKSQKMLENVGKALAFSGKGQVEMDRIIYNLKQIGDTGKITEMDVRQFGSSGIDVLALLADYYKTTKEKAGDMVKNSKNAFGDLEKAFAKAGGAGGKFKDGYANVMGSFNQVLSNAKDNWNIFANDFVTKTGIFDSAKQALGGLNQIFGDNQNILISIAQTALAPLTDAFKNLMGGVGDLSTKLQEWWKTNQEFIQPQLGRIRDAIQQVIDKFASLFQPVTDAKTNFNDLANNGVKLVADQFVNAKDGVIKFIDWLKSDDGKKAIADFTTGAKNLGSALKIISDAIITIASNYTAIKNTAEAIGRIQAGIGSLGISEVIRYFQGKSSSGSKPQSGGASFAVGTKNVPFDMVAQIHKGEAIIPVDQNPYTKPQGRQSAGNTTIQVIVQGTILGVNDLIETVARGVSEGQARTNKLARLGI